MSSVTKGSLCERINQWFKISSKTELKGWSVVHEVYNSRCECNRVLSASIFRST